MNEIIGDTQNIFIQYLDLPTSIPARLVKNDDGSYTIFLNARLDAYSQKLAYIHELKHIAADDFHSDLPVDQLENLRHKI